MDKRPYIELTRKVGIIYLLEDPRPEKFGCIRYVGQTTNSLGDRLASHVCSARNGSAKSPVMDWIRMLDHIGLRPCGRVYRVVPVDDLDTEEQRCIGLFRALYPDLLNFLDGGSSWSEASRIKAGAAKRRYYEDHPEARVARREAVLRFWEEHPDAKQAFDLLRYGRHVDPATRAKASVSIRRYYATHPGSMLGKKGKSPSLEVREMLRKLHTGRRLSPEACRKIGERSRGHKVSADARARIGAARKTRDGSAAVHADFNRTVTIGGVTKTLLEWGEEAQKSGRVTWRSVRDRIYVYGWDPVEAIVTPKGACRHANRKKQQGPMPTGPWPV